MLFTWLLLCGFILLLVPQSLTNRLQFTFARVFHWPLSFGRSISLSSRMSQSRSDVVNRQDYERLRIHLANIEAKLGKANETINELSGLRNRYPLSGAAFVPANVITATIDKMRCELLINRGEDDGLGVGQFVLANNSVIGTISGVSPRTARVRLITDRDSKIAVKIGGAKRTMHGLGGNQAKAPMIKQKMKEDDRILASEMTGYLDVPMVIGKVVKCENNSDSALLCDITVEPVCDIERLTKVAVVVMNPK